jgi:hypothetical protein
MDSLDALLVTLYMAKLELTTYTSGGQQLTWLNEANLGLDMLTLPEVDENSPSTNSGFEDAFQAFVKDFNSQS